MSSIRSTGINPVPSGKTELIATTISWIFGVAALAAGLVNCFFGNDPYFGIFIIGLSLVFFPPVANLVHKFLGFTLPGPLKFLLALFIIWVLLGVGELFSKIDIMTYQLG